MDDMIDRGADAMRARRRELISQPLDRIWPDLMRAAIEAMSEPTSHMCQSACNALKKHVDSFTEEERLARWPGRKDEKGWRVPNKEKHRVRYQAMIGAALKVSA